MDLKVCDSNHGPIQTVIKNVTFFPQREVKASDNTILYPRLLYIVYGRQGGNNLIFKMKN